MIRDLALALCLCLALQALTAPQTSKVAPQSTISPCLDSGGTDYCKCLENPEACREEMPELWEEMFGSGSLETDAILELWECP